MTQTPPGLPRWFNGFCASEENLAIPLIAAL